MSKRTIEIENLSGGQPRPYADHQYEYRVRVLLHDHNGSRAPSDDWAKKIAIANVANGMINKAERKVDTLDNYAASYIDEIRVEEPGVVFIRTKTPYID